MHNIVMVRMVSVMLALCLWGAVLAAEEIKPGEKDKCPVCGMFVAPYPNWVAAVRFKDGALAFFDGPKDMFKYLLQMDKYDKNKSRDHVAGVYVTEYYTTKLVPAEDLYFVAGSDVMGPMGRELVPVMGKENAETFMKDHKGTKMFQYEEVTAEDIPKGKM